jgi:transcriptional regulator with XRE-family HTH domain
MTTDDLRTSHIELNTVDASNPVANDNDGSLGVVPRKLNRVSSMSFPSGAGGPTTVGQRLIVRRLALGLTQEEVASKVMFRPKSGKRENHDCPLSRNAYCMYERDLVPASLKMVEGLANALGVSPAWLAFGIGAGKTKKLKGLRLKASTRPGRYTNLWRNKRFTASGE